MISYSDECFNYIHYITIYIRDGINRLNDPIHIQNFYCFETQILFVETEFIYLFFDSLDQSQLSFLIQRKVSFRVDVGNAFLLPYSR